MGPIGDFLLPDSAEEATQKGVSAATHRARSMPPGIEVEGMTDRKASRSLRFSSAMAEGTRGGGGGLVVKDKLS